MLATTWGPLASTVASMVVRHPGLGRRLLLAPAWAIHASAAYIQVMLAAEHHTEEIAAAIESQHARDLLGQAVPNPHERLASTLKRVSPPVHDLAYYRRLNDILQSPAAEVIFEAGQITTGLLNVAETIAADPVLRAAHRALGSSESDVTSLATALTYLRSLHVADDIEALPPGSGWRAILRRCKSDLARIRAPAPPFAIPSSWRAVETLGELFEIGTRLGNCVAGLRVAGDYHVAGLITGRVLYLTHKKVPSLVSIQNVGPRLWAWGEVSISRDARQSFAKEQAALVYKLKAAAAEVALELYEQCPIAALSSLAWRADLRRVEAPEDEVDAG